MGTLTPEQIKEAIDNCANEPVHIPGSVQPHGFFIALNGPLTVVTHVSENIYELLGLSVSNLLESGLPDYLKSQWEDKVLKLRQLSSPSLGFETLINGQGVYCIMYLAGDTVCVEIEPVAGKLSSTFLSELQEQLELIRKTDSVDETLSFLTKSVAHITNFERVMIYKFDEEWNGKVVAEYCREATIRSYLHQRFPSTDIPSQVRELYKKNPLRSIVDSRQQPVKIISFLADGPIDMTLGVLRAVSPIHLNYMQNMGLDSSLSVAIFQEDKLWGLLSCHALKRHPLNVQQRHAVQAMVILTSQRLILQQQYQETKFFEDVEDTRAALIGSNRDLSKPATLFQQQGSRWLSLFNSSLIALVYDSEMFHVGCEIAHHKLIKIEKWLHREYGLKGYYETRDLSNTPFYSELEGSGLFGLMAIALPFGIKQQGWLMFFRTEHIEELEWAGKPSKETIKHYQGKLVMSPRASFASWKETVKGSSAAWSVNEKKAAKSLSEDLAIALSADEVEQLNDRLQKANEKLEHLVHTDALTQIWNRYHMESVIEEQISAAERYEQDLSIILFDVDNFKQVNDSYGHEVGDNVLMGLSKLLKEQLRDTDDLGRWGGEEFLVIAKHSDVEATKQLAERLRSNLERADFGEAGTVTASFGVTQYRPVESSTHLIKRVDDALYEAKEGGRNRVVTNL